MLVHTAILPYVWSWKAMPKPMQARRSSRTANHHRLEGWLQGMRWVCIFTREHPHKQAGSYTTPTKGTSSHALTTNNCLQQQQQLPLTRLAIYALNCINRPCMPLCQEHSLKDTHSPAGHIGCSTAVLQAKPAVSL